MTDDYSLPSNVHISQHPCVRAKLSQLRSHQNNGRETKTLVHEIALILGCEALCGNLDVVDGEKVRIIVIDHSRTPAKDQT